MQVKTSCGGLSHPASSRVPTALNTVGLVPWGFDSPLRPLVMCRHLRSDMAVPEIMEPDDRQLQLADEVSTDQHGLGTAAQRYTAVRRH